MAIPCRLFSCTKMTNRIRSIEVLPRKVPMGRVRRRTSRKRRGICSSDLSALIGVLEAGQRIVGIVAQAGDGFGAGISPAHGEAPGGGRRPGAIGSDGAQTLPDGFLLCEPCRGRS